VMASWAYRILAGGGGFEVVKEVDRSLPNWPKEYASNLCSIL
jgi:hypothetical protein